MSMQRQPSTIVHIGAGRCSEYEEYRATGAKRIFLIEPDTESAGHLREALFEHNNVQVIEKAVVSCGDSATLRLFNARGFSSLREPTGLRTLYPGLRNTGELYPDMWTVRQMCDELNIKESESNWLVVDAPGAEQAILNSLNEEDLLRQFELVSFYAGILPLYEGNTPAEDILRMLEVQGYEKVSFLNKAEPERPRWTLFRDVVKVLNTQLETRIAELESRTTALSNELEKQTKEAKKFEFERDQESQTRESAESERDKNAQTIIKLNSEVERLNNELEQSTGEAEKLKAQTENLQVELNKLKAEHEDKKLARESVERERNEKAKVANEAVAKLEKLEKELFEQKKKASMILEEHTGVQSENTELQIAIKKLEDQLKRSQSENAELKSRQSLTQEEMRKAEGQIDLIKELLLRERDS